MCAYGLSRLLSLIPAINSVIAQFDDVNPYHWPGWFQVALAATVGLLALFFFVETRSLSQAKLSCRPISCFTGLKLEAQLQTKCTKLTVSFTDCNTIGV